MRKNKDDKKRCSFRCPVAKDVGDDTHKLYAIYCDCGVTIFGNTIKECNATWRRHIGGEL